MQNKLTLQEFATPLAAKHQFLKVGIGGFAGSGKSTTGAHIVAGAYKDMKCTKPVLFLDNENGSRFLIPFFKQQGIEVLAKDSTYLADVIAAMDYLERGEIGFLFMDTLTKVYYQYIRDYRRANGHWDEQNKRWRKFMTLQDWGKVLPAWQEEFSDKYVAIKGNILFTGRGGFEYEKEEDEKDDEGRVTKKGQFVKSGVKMKLAGETPFEPDLNIWMELEQDIVGGNLQQWREAQVLKDRSALIDGKVFKNPSYNDFKPVVDLLMSLHVGAVAGATDTENRAPSEDFDWTRRKQSREIEIEKIKAAFDGFGLSTSVADKQIKTEIYNKAFGTTSQTEFERFDSDKLAFMRTVLVQLLEKLQSVEPAHRVEFVKSWEYEEPGQLSFDKPQAAATEKKNGTAPKADGAQKADLKRSTIRKEELLGKIRKAKKQTDLQKVEQEIQTAVGQGDLYEEHHQQLLEAVLNKSKSFETVLAQ